MNNTKSGWSLLRMWFAFLQLILLAFIGYSLYDLRMQRTSVQTQAIPQPLESPSARPGFPVRLKIPSIQVDAAIESVGVTPEGQMSSPTNTFEVGWFNLGPRPGEKGSAVIAGHFDGENGQSGVFVDLNKLQMGDTFTVEDEAGVATTFIVRGSQMFDPGYAEEVFSRNAGVHLNLITCDGVWDDAKKSYTKRLVVFADMEYFSRASKVD